MRNVFNMTDLNYKNNTIKVSNIKFNIIKNKHNNELQKALKEAEHIKKHPSEYKSYDNINDLFNELDSNN